MLVSHRYKFIYTKTRKTAGSSVESYFEPFCMPDGEWTQRHFREEYVSDAGIIGFRGNPAKAGDAYWWNHMPARMIRRRLGEDTWRSYFKFCVIGRSGHLRLFYISLSLPCGVRKRQNCAA